MSLFFKNEVFVEALRVITLHPGLTKQDIEIIVGRNLKFLITFEGYINDELAKLENENFIFMDTETRHDFLAVALDGNQQSFNIDFQITEEKYYPMSLKYMWKKYRCEMCNEC